MNFETGALSDHQLTILFLSFLYIRIAANMRYTGLSFLAGLHAVTAVNFNTYDHGYYLPSSGLASTTQFCAGPEFAGGTARGVRALPNGKATSGKQGGGPGHLYASELMWTDTTFPC